MQKFFLSCKDQNFIEFIGLIQSFFLERNIFVCRSTIEGSLINIDNLNDFWRFCCLKKYSIEVQAKIKNIYDSLQKNDQTNFMRLLFNGKSDFLLKLEEIGQFNKGFDPKLHELIKENRVSKTDGWVTQWMNYSLCLSVGIDPNSTAAFSQFKKKLSDPAKRYVSRNYFQRYFSELYLVINTIQKQLEN